MTENGPCLPIEPPPGLTVRWVDRLEQLTLFSYQNGTFYATGHAADRAAIATGASVTITIQGTVAMQVTGGAVKVAEVRVMGGTMAPEGRAGTSPAIEFWVGETRVGSLTESGVLRVATLEETAGPLTGGEGVFAFYCGGTLTATLGLAGLAALAVTEE